MIFVFYLSLYLLEYCRTLMAIFSSIFLNITSIIFVLSSRWGSSSRLLISGETSLTKIPHEHVPKSHVNTCDYICDHMWFWNMFMWNFCKRSLDNKRPSKRFLKSFFSLNIRSFGLIRTLPYSLFSYQVFYFIDWLTAAPCTLQAGWNLYMGDFKKS